MKPLLYLLMAVGLLTACSDNSPERQAAVAAQGYYNRLIDGNVQAFLNGKAGADTLPAAYREQLLVAIRQYQTDMERKHRGLCAVRVADEHYQQDAAACRDTSLHITYAFLLLSFADSTQEEIAVPMVEHRGHWMMK